MVYDRRMGYPFQAFSSETYTLAAGVPRTVDVPLNGSARWRVNLFVLAGGAGPVTALQFAVSATNASDFGPLQAPASPPMPIPVGTSGQLFGTEAGVVLRLELTSAAGCDVTISLGGF
jgi:hypothetical protein